MDTGSLNSFPWQVISPVALLIALLSFIVNLVFAAGIASDAGRLQDEGEEIHFAGPIVWALATVFGGILVVAAYWLIHHSALRPDSGDDDAPPEPTSLS